MLYVFLYTAFVFSLFVMFLYLLAKVDPGLIDVPEKAAKMVSRNRHNTQAEIELNRCLRKIQVV